MSATVYTVLGSVPELRIAAAANVANLLAAAGDDVAVVDLQPRTAPPPLCDHGDRGLGTALAGDRTASTLATPVEAAPTTASADARVFGGGSVSLVPLTTSLATVVPPDDDPADAAGRVLDDLASSFDAVCALAPPLPDLVGVDRLWVATLNETAVRSRSVVGVLDTADPGADCDRLRSAERGGVRTDCTLAVQSDATAPPPTTVRDPPYPLQGRVPAADPWAEAAADAYREFVTRLDDASLDGLAETPPTLVDPGGERRETEAASPDGENATVPAASGDAPAVETESEPDPASNGGRRADPGQFVDFAEGGTGSPPGGDTAADGRRGADDTGDGTGSRFRRLLE